jgi:hypothetical protein
MTKEFQSTNYEVNLRTPNDELPTAFMQNKPNFLKYPMNTSPVMTKHYEQIALLPATAKQTQSKPNKPNPTPVFQLQLLDWQAE